MAATKGSAPPIDRGWAWVVMIAVFFNMMLCIGYIRSFGILFFEFSQMYNASSSVTALVMGVQGGVFSISGFLAQNVLNNYMSARVTIMSGGVLSSSGIICSYFADSIPVLIVTQSIFIGCGNALIIGPGLVLLSKYFNKHRSLATAVANTGANIGAIAMPPLIRFLLDEFGMKGVFLIYGALTLNILVFGALLRPIEIHPQADGNHNVPSDKTENEEQNSEKLIQKNGIPEILITAPEVKRLLSENEADHDYGPRSRTTSSSSRTFKGFMETFTESSAVKYTSTPDLACLTVSVQDITSSPKDTQDKHCCNAFMEKIIDFSLFRMAKFYFLMATALFGVMCGAMMGIYIPALGTDKGLSKDEATLILSANGAMGALSRILMGFFADRGIMKRNHILALALFIASVTSLIAPVYEGFTVMMVYSLINGFTSSLYFSLIPVIIVDFLGLEKLSKTFGFLQLIHGASLAAGHPIAGLLRDISGNFNASYQFFGASGLMAALFLMLEPCAERCDKRVYTDTDPCRKDIVIVNTKSTNGVTQVHSEDE